MYESEEVTMTKPKVDSVVNSVPVLDAPDLEALPMLDEPELKDILDHRSLPFRAQERTIPMGNFTIIETILRERAYFFATIRDAEDLWPKIRAMLISCVTFFAIYGAVMGGAHSIMQAISSLV